MNTWDSLSRVVKDITTGDVTSTDTRPVRDVYAQGMMAPQYSALTFPVAAGAHCIYEGELYAAKQAIAASEAWTAAHWDKVQLGAEVAKVGASVTDLKSQTNAMSTATATDVGKALSPKTVTDGKVTEWKFVSAGGGGGGGAVQDIQIDGTSILDAQGVANVPVAGTNFGVVKTDSANGIYTTDSGILRISAASSSAVKSGVNSGKPIVPAHQHESAFYGLAQAAGDTTQSQSSNTVGNYTESAKSAIHEMLNGFVAVTGTTPTITALPGIRYICGEVATLDITLPASGIIDVVFTSGSTPAVLTVTPPTGQTMKWANGFDPDNLESDTTYEVNIADGCLGVAGTWS